jgi:N-acyl-D-amino-acid deacylase
MIVFMISEENLRAALRLPFVSIGSDSITIPASGPLAQGAPHPRTFGTFTRVLARYARDQKLLSWEEAVHKMTGLSARRLRLEDRGMVKTGLRADLVVLDPQTIADQSTFEDPFRYPTGILHVLCNGTPVLADGKPTGARPGRVLARN